MYVKTSSCYYDYQYCYLCLVIRKNLNTTHEVWQWKEGKQVNK